ncbi:MAG: MBL fold metallo-hydrolase [Dokdonella sp.]
MQQTALTDTRLDAAAGIVRNARAGEAARPHVTTFFDESTFTASHVIRDPSSNACAIVDSVWDFDHASGRCTTGSASGLVDFVREHDLHVQWLLETHVHADHLSAARFLHDQVGGCLAIGQHITDVQQVFGKIFNAGDGFARDGSQFDHLFADGEHFRIGALQAIALHVPGHTPACMAYVVGDTVFVGDTLFMPDFGTARCDFPGGDAATLFRSIRRLQQLPDEARVYLCHDYKAPGRDTYVWETTIGEQRTGNLHVREGISETEFVAMREARDATLPMPNLILPSVQVNMCGGRLPEPEDNGVRYLKLPINLL